MVCSLSGRRVRALNLALVLIGAGACRGGPTGSIPVERSTDTIPHPALYDFARRAGHGTVVGEMPRFDFGPIQTGKFLLDD